MSMDHISKSTFDFLKELKKNNTREWFEENKKRFRAEETEIKRFFKALHDEMVKHDEIDKVKVFRIYRDVRFSKDKTPYKTHFSASFHRIKPKLRGGYYTHIEPGNTFIACGFWEPNKEDLLRIRKEFEIDASEMREIIYEKNFKKLFGDLVGEEVKTAPKGFDKEHPNIDLIKKKQYIFVKNFTDKEASSPGFINEINNTFKSVRPWFNCMSDVLTTDLNGVSLIN